MRLHLLLITLSLSFFIKAGSQLNEINCELIEKQLSCNITHDAINVFNDFWHFVFKFPDSEKVLGYYSKSYSVDFQVLSDDKREIGYKYLYFPLFVQQPKLQSMDLSGETPCIIINGINTVFFGDFEKNKNIRIAIGMSLLDGGWKITETTFYPYKEDKAICIGDDFPPMPK